MNTWHDRLQTALNIREKDWSDLVRATGKTKPSVYAWKPLANDRAVTMNAENAALVCDYLKINALWLFHEKGQSGLEEPPVFDRKATSTVTLKPKTDRDKLIEELIARAARLSDTGIAILLGEAKVYAEIHPLPSSQTVKSFQ